MTSVDAKADPIGPLEGLPSIYDQDQDFIKAVNDEVFSQTQIERDWVMGVNREPHKAGLTPFTTDTAIEAAAEAGELVYVGHSRRAGYRPIWRLENDPNYSPPFLRPSTKQGLEFITGLAVNQLFLKYDISDVEYALTSLVRSTQYQDRLAEAYGKIAINPSRDPSSPIHSSHELAIAVDIDGCGYYKDGHKVNPREPGYMAEFNPAVMHELRAALAFVSQWPSPGVPFANVVREMEGFSEEVFHVVINPYLMQYSPMKYRELLAAGDMRYSRMQESAEI